MRFAKRDKEDPRPATFDRMSHVVHKGSADMVMNRVGQTSMAVVVLAGLPHGNRRYVRATSHLYTIAAFSLKICSSSVNHARLRWTLLNVTIRSVQNQQIKSARNRRLDDPSRIVLPRRPTYCPLLRVAKSRLSTLPGPAMSL